MNTGMRHKEQYLLIEWPYVDFLRSDLFVPESKNGASRHIPLNADTVGAFKELYRRNGNKGPIFQSERGERERLLGARHWFEDAIVNAGISNFTWHDLRHTFASRLVMAGVDLRTVADLLGHRTIQMTMRYAHLAPAHKQDPVDKLAAFNRAERERCKNRVENDYWKQARQSQLAPAIKTLRKRVPTRFNNVFIFCKLGC